MVRLAEEFGLGRFLLWREGPTIRTTEDKATFFKYSQSLTEAGVVDAQLLTQRGS